MTKPTRRRGLALLLGLGLCGGLAAETLEIVADSQDVDGRNGTATYEGNVEIHHGDLFITAERAVFHESEPGVYRRAVMSGNPVTLVATPKDRPRTEASARHMAYDLQAETLLMEGNARLQQAQRELRAERIDYDMPAERIQARRGEGEEERVRVRFEQKATENGEENGS